MSKGKKALVTVCVVCAIAVAGGMALLSQTGVGMWFVRSTFDRVNPLAAEQVLYAQAPVSQDLIETYADASGGYDNYVYELDAADAAGAHRTVYLISFTEPLEVSTGWLELTAKGTYVSSYRAQDQAKVPAAAHEALAGA